MQLFSGRVWTPVRVRGPAGANESGSSTRCLSDGCFGWWLILGHELDMGCFFRETGWKFHQPDELKVEMVDGPRVEMFFGGIAGKFINMGNKKADAWTSDGWRDGYVTHMMFFVGLAFRKGTVEAQG